MVSVTRLWRFLFIGVITKMANRDELNRLLKRGSPIRAKLINDIVAEALRRIDVSGGKATNIGQNLILEIDKQPGASGARVRPGIITAWNAADSHAARYNAAFENARGINVVVNGKPLDRIVDTDVEIVSAAVGDWCILIQLDDPSGWYILRTKELPATRVCSQEANAGAGSSTYTTAVEQSADLFIPNTALTATNNLIFNVVGGTNEKYGIPLYTFTRGHLGIESAVINMIFTRVLATGITGAAVGTTDATGTSGNTLTGTEQNIITATNLGALAASPGTAFQLGTASQQFLDATTTGGSETKAYLNIAKGVGSWSNSTTITVTGSLKIKWYNSGDY